jgi:hypothetical protein
MMQLGSRALFATQPAPDAAWEWWTTNGMRGGTRPMVGASMPDPQDGAYSLSLTSAVYLVISQPDDLSFPQFEDLWRLYP